MSKFVSGCKVVCEFSNGKAGIAVLKEKMKALSGGFQWIVSGHEGVINIFLEKNIFKISNGKIKIGDYAYNPISSYVTLIEEDADLIYVNDNYYKVQDYKKPKENKHESHNT